MTFSRKMKLNRKGVIEDSIRPISGTLIAALLIIFVILPFSISLYKIFFGQENQGTRESMNSIDQMIRTTEHGKSSSKSINIKNGYMIVGFNKGSNKIEETCCIDDEIWKPAVCGLSACLCLCEEGDCESPLRCIIYKITVKVEEEEGIKGGISDVGEEREIDCFIGPDEEPNYGDDNSAGCEGKSLVLYGNCNCDFSGDFQVKNIKVTNQQIMDQINPGLMV